MLDIVCTHNHAKHMWNALEENFKQKSDDQIVELRDELNNLSFKVGDDLRAFIRNYRAIVNELGSLNCIITPKQHMIKLLKKLPAEFFSIRLQLESVAETPTWDSLTGQLLSLYDAISNKTLSHQSAATLSTAVPVPNEVAMAVQGDKNLMVF